MNRFLFLMLLISGQALASDFLSPPASDMSLTMLLQPIFGSLFGGSGDGPLGEAILIFNTGCLTLGGLLAAYTMVFGTMQTAHDGEMLGKKWSSMWVPIRLVVGTAALVPIGSFCAAQMLVAWLAMQGIGLADSVWSAFAHSAMASQKLASGTAPTASVSKLAFGMLRSQVCMAGFKRLATEGENIGEIFPGTPSASGSMDKIRRYSVPGFSATQCGGVVGSAATGGAVASVAGFFGINTGAAEKAAAIRQAHATASTALEGEMASVASLIVSNNPGSVNERYVRAIAQYQQTVGAAAKSQMGDQAYFTELSDNASRDGWLLAGSWYLRLASLEDAMMKALADSPESLPVEKGPEDMSRYYEALNGAVHDPSATGIDNQLVADKAREDSESGLLMSALNGVFNKISQASGAGFNFLTEADSERHPLMVAISSGHTMLGWAVGLGAASVVVSHLGGVTISMVLAALVMALIGGGITLAYVLPMLPFIIWIGACSGFLLCIIEAVLGAPLWAICHLNPRGEEFHGGASSGYMLVLEMTLKPVLMIFGFCAATVVSVPLGQFINRVFYSTFSLNQNGFVGFISMLAAMGIYAGLTLAMMKFTFSFIHKVPDQLMKWIGGGHGSGLAEASGAASASEHQSAAVVGAVTGAVSGGVTSKLNQMAHRERTKENSPPSVAPETHLANQAMQAMDAHDKGVQKEADSAFKDDTKTDESK